MRIMLRMKQQFMGYWLQFLADNPAIAQQFSRVFDDYLENNHNIYEVFEKMLIDEGVLD
jgi:hypothetical protein